MDASVKEWSQTLLVPSKNILNRQTLIVRRENVFCKFHIFFGFVETKNKIRCIDATKYAFTHRNLPESEKYI